MATGVQVWSGTAATNASADTNINWAEGMAPSQVNDSARAEMASVAKWRDDNNGSIVTGGSSTAYTVVTNQIEAALTAGYTIAVQFHATNDSSATLVVDGLAAKPIQVIPGTNLAGQEFVIGSIQKFTYSTTGTGQWLAQSNVSAASQGYASLTKTDQTLSGGANVTSFAISSSTGITIDCGKSPLQYVTRNAALNITAPSNDGSCIVNVTNASGAGALTFTGFTVGSNTGDSSTSTTTGNIYSISIWRVNGVASYFVKALQ